jgi:hypothetical protein
VLLVHKVLLEVKVQLEKQEHKVLLEQLDRKVQQVLLAHRVQ